MTLTAPARRTPATARRFGYVVAVLINGVLLYAANVWPGWAAVPFLTADTWLVMGLVNASIIANLAVNVVYLVADPPWVKALGTTLTAVVGFAASLRIWQVFPFDFSGYWFDWTLVTRIVLGVAIVGTAIGIVAGFVTLVKSAATRTR